VSATARFTDPAAYYDGTILPYRLVFAGGVFARFREFSEVIDYLRFTKCSTATAIINDDKTDGGKRQGLSEDEYLQALEVLQ
jgi:hypothetical protein